MRKRFAGVMLPEALRAVKIEQRRRGKRQSKHTSHESAEAALRRQRAGSTGRYTPPK